ncbi:tetratricopeptide repeat protein [Kitasatospora sp. NBC_00085]|uniref:AfsR/SARP family transcriptional regulator n=1 Tax=Kitasatospora sp. NBC_00085 TaxID=2903566 RepID=UPI0032568BCA
MDGLRIAILGPLRAWRGERELDTGPAQRRAVLAALALRSGRVAAAEDLVWDVWGAESPTSAPAALRNHVSRLRAALETQPSAPKVLISRAGGYALRLADGALDLTEAERLQSEAEAAEGRGDLEAAAWLLGTAADLWDGAPLTGVPGDSAQRHRDRLTEYRLVLIEARLELELRLGRHTPAVAELTSLADEHPLRERLRELQMLALYRCGRQGEALAAFATARELLAEELGIDPGPGLVRLHQRILTADPTLAAPPSTAAAPAATSAAGRARQTGANHPWTPPAQLPPDVPDFTARSEDVAAVLDALDHDSRTSRTAPAVWTIHGMGGVGKTALAVHVAHIARARFPDGQLYADLRGAGAEAADPYEVQEVFLRTLGVASENIPADRAERTALYRSRLSGRDILLLLDNATGTEQVSPLLPGTSECAVLVTSRAPLTCLPTTGRTALEPLSEPEAISLLERIAGADRCRREPQASRDLVRASGMLPLAVRIVGSRLAARPRWSVAFLAERLDDRRQRLVELETGSLAVEPVFDLGYSALEADQARAFRLLAIPDLADVSVAAAAAILECDRRAAEAILDELAHVGLLEPCDPGRYRYHDLLRLFARHRTLATDASEVRQKVLGRIARFHLSGTAAAIRVEWPHSRLRASVDPNTGSTGLAFTGEAQAQQWVINELPAMLSVAAQILDHPYRPIGVEDTRTLAGLLALLTAYTDLCMPWPALGALAHKLIGAGERHGERAAVMYGCAVAAIACAHLGRHEEARSLARRAYETPPTPGLDMSHRMLHVMGMVAGKRPDGLEEALDHNRRARDLSGAVGDISMTARCALELAPAHLALGQPHEALEAARDALAGCRAAESPAGVVVAQRSLAEALAALGRYDEALAEYRAALALCEMRGLRTQHARTLLSCASALVDAGRNHEADAYLTQALTAVVRLGDTVGEQRARALLGRLAAVVPAQG